MDCFGAYILGHPVPFRVAFPAGAMAGLVESG